MPHVDQARWENLRGDIAAAVESLRAGAPAPRSTFTTGFCMGGRLSSMSATLGLGLAGVIPFYGWPVGPNRNGTPAPADEAKKIECDVLAIYGEADTGIPQEARDAYVRALEEAGVRQETIVEPGAPHGFFDRRAEQHREAADDAWNRTLAFIRRHTMGQPIAAAPPTASGDSVGGSASLRANGPDDEADPRIELIAGDD
jgi:carboxymethylenebutenolidase